MFAIVGPKYRKYRELAARETVTNDKSIQPMSQETPLAQHGSSVIHSYDFSTTCFQMAKTKQVNAAAHSDLK